MSAYYNLDSSLRGAVVDYTGKQVLSLEVVADPNANAYAVRAVVRWLDGAKTRATDRPIDFLVKLPYLRHVTADDLEECDYESWPPQVRR